MMMSYDINVRTIIDLPEDQIRALSDLCHKEHISRAEAIRRAVQKLLNEHSKEETDSAFGIWKNRKEDSRNYVERIRAEWDKR